MALDGSLFDVADTQANAAAFGRSCNQYGKGAYPQARAVMLNECGSHVTVGLHLGDYDEAEIHGAYALLPKLARGMLLMHDANFFGGAYLERSRQRGACVVRLAEDRGAQAGAQSPGWQLSGATQAAEASGLSDAARRVAALIEYQITDERVGEPGRVYRLGTTWLNPRTAPATS